MWSFPLIQELKTTLFNLFDLLTIGISQPYETAEDLYTCSVAISNRV